MGWVQALPVNEKRALLVAQNFLRMRGIDPQGLSNLTAKSDFSMFYVFGRTDAFVIVSADDAVRPVLGYSLSNGIRLSGMDEALEQWLQDYEAQVAEVQRLGITPNATTRDRWDALENGRTLKLAKASLPPMLKTQWNQSPYYNAQCPYDEDRQTNAVTGCVATTMAQIMRYWEYPSKGKGSHSYESRYGTLSVDFSTHEYNWSIMPPVLSATSSQSQVDAVAKLMSDCGISVNMDYSVDGSGANVNNARTAWIEHFGYSSDMSFITRDGISDNDWKSFIKYELNEGRPVCHIGCGANGGCHAWVCDGYDDDNLLHMNWGWGSYGDGYYEVGALNPGSEGIGSGGNTEFNSNNIILIGIAPPNGLRVSVDTVPMSVNGDSLIISVFASSSERSWQAATNSDWLSIANASGAGMSSRGELVVFADTNWTDASRTATVTISQGSQQQSVTIVQYSCGAITMLPYEESFEGLTTSCWHTETLGGSEDTLFTIITTTDYVREGEHSLQFSFDKKEPARRQFLISPELRLSSAARLTFDYCREWSYTEHFVVLYSTTDDAAESFIYLVGDGGMMAAGWNSFEGIVPQEARYIAICYDNGGVEGRYWVVDHIQLTAAESCGDNVVMPYVQDFDESMDCWTKMSRNMENMSLFGLTSSGQARSPQSVFRFAANKKAANYNQYLVSPRLSLSEPTDLSFYYRRSGSGEERFCLMTSTTGSTPECFAQMGDTVIVSTSDWTEYTAKLPAGTQFVAINYSPYSGKYLYIDDIRFLGEGGTASIDQAGEQPSVRIAVKGRFVEIQSVEGRPVRLYDVSGRLLDQRLSGQDNVRLATPAAGVYLVQIGTEAVRKVVVF